MKFSRIIFFTSSALFAPLLFAQNNLPEAQIMSAKPITLLVDMPNLNAQNAPQPVHFSPQELQHNPALLEGLLHSSIIQQNAPLLQQLLPIYQQQAESDPILVQFAQAKIAQLQGKFQLAITHFQQILAQHPTLNPVRIELAIALFLDYQTRQAKIEFERALNEKDTPNDVKMLISHYLAAIKKRESWQVSVSGGYLREKNVNKVSDNPIIENTAFVKGEKMRPIAARGASFSLSFERQFNLHQHYFAQLENQLFGKIYWNQHDFDDITNRTLFGFGYQSANFRAALLPFYERQWFAGQRYKKTQGARLEWQIALTPHWQLSHALEYGNNRYRNAHELNGNHKLASATLIWTSARHYLFAGVDYNLERSQKAQYSYDYYAIRAGFGRRLAFDIDSRVILSAAKRQYRDNLTLSALRFDKARRDHFYSATLSIAKTNWQWLGITPRLQLTWKQQRSNFASLYSYVDKNVNLFFEKSF